MKFIIDNKIYDTDKSTLLCVWEEKSLDLLEVGRRHEIYITKKRQVFHVSYGPMTETFTETLDNKKALELFNAHSSGIIYENYLANFETEEG